MKSNFLPRALLSCLLLAGCQSEPIQHVGPLPGGGHMVTTHQLLHPAGDSVEFTGRPVDLVLAPDGRTVYVKDNRGVVVIDAATWQIRQELKLSEGGGSTHGIAISRDGTRLFVTTAQNALWEARVAPDGKVTWGRKTVLLGPGRKGDSHAGGIALSPDEKTAYVCLSRNNALGVVDLAAAKVVKEIPVGVAPFDVVVGADGNTAYVSNWGGRHPKTGEKSAQSAGTETLVDERGVASSGTVSVVDLVKGQAGKMITTGLHPSDLELSADQHTLYVANANSDSVSVIDTATQTVVKTLVVRPDPALPFGSAPNALALSRDNATLYVANGGNNAVALVSLGQPARLAGLIPAAWYPGAVATDGKFLYIANVKGLGSRGQVKKQSGWKSRDYLGTVTKVAVPSAATLEKYTQQVKTDACVPEVLRALEKSAVKTAPVPVPRRVGEPSVFEHVVYIIKENRTYDQVFGDLPKGNRDPALCVFGREATPNHHALVEQFALLDNYYCNGVLSADGHQWAMEGFVTDYLEKAFGGFTRSYPYSGDDPLCFAPTGFIWDNVLLHGLSFRNYGEMSKTTPVPSKASFKEIYADFKTGAGKIKFEHDIQIESLRQYSCPDSPGWNLKIPDCIRAEVFLKEFAEFEQKGTWPNLVIIYLPSDHTSGTRPGGPTPRAQVADNDLAVGRIIDRISHSKFWPKTCVFVNEDDPQAGFDHVDGHRSLCLVVSPYTKRGAVVSQFYNQTSVLHTMELMLGIPPMNQMDALAPAMKECFTLVPDLTPFTVVPNQIPIDEMNKAVAELNGLELHWANQSIAQNFDDVDRADEDTLNRILWHAVKGVDAPYPAQLAGAHGKGLKKLHLRFGAGGDDDDD